MDNVVDYITANRQRYIEELDEVLRIASISSSPDHRGEVAYCAEYLARHLEKIGFDYGDVLPTGPNGHPMVYGEWRGAPGKPTLLVYGHYDVQPVDPLDQWLSPPFEPTIRDGELYARGSVDDKGQVYAHLKAAEAFLTIKGELPVNLKVIVEGEEEIGSEHLAGFLERERERLAADAVIISDTPMFGRDIPSLCVGLRGLCYLEVFVRGPQTDLHSGSWGGVVANPAIELARLIASLKDAQGRITIPGFYDRVRALSAEERAALAALPDDDRDVLQITGAPALSGEAGYSTLERLWTRPTLDVNGMVSGFTGPGSKTIIPAQASAKISMRLVPDQDPDEIADLFERQVRAWAPDSVRIAVARMHGGLPFLSPTDNPSFRAAERALARAFGREPVHIREGGSIPFVADIQRVLGRPCILMGFGLPDENAHAPNEHLNLENYQKGILSCAYLYDELGQLRAAG